MKHKRSLVGARVELSPGYDLWMRGARFGVIRKVEGGIATVKMDHPSVKRLQRIPLKDLRSAAHGSEYGGLVDNLANFLSKSVGGILKAAAQKPHRADEERRKRGLIDLVPRLIPKVLMTRYGTSPVVRVETFPPGQHPAHTPIVANMIAVKATLADGHHRWFGTTKAWITSRLRMAILVNPRDEVLFKWEKVKE